MCSKAVRMEPHSLEIVPYYLNTQEMCNKAVRIESYTLKHVPDHLETQQMCNKAVHVKPAPFFLLLTTLRAKRCVLKQSKKTQEMCDKTVSEDHYYLQYVTNCFVTSEQAII